MGQIYQEPCSTCNLSNMAFDWCKTNTLAEHWPFYWFRAWAVVNLSLWAVPCSVSTLLICLRAGPCMCYQIKPQKWSALWSIILVTSSVRMTNHELSVCLDFFFFFESVKLIVLVIWHLQQTCIFFFPPVLIYACFSSLVHLKPSAGMFHLNSPWVFSQSWLISCYTMGEQHMKQYTQGSALIFPKEHIWV